MNFPLSAALVAPAKFQYVHFHLPQSKMGKPKRTFWPAPVPLDIKFSPVDDKRSYFLNLI